MLIPKNNLSDNSCITPELEDVKKQLFMILSETDDAENLELRPLVRKLKTSLSQLDAWKAEYLEMPLIIEEEKETFEIDVETNEIITSKELEIRKIKKAKDIQNYIEPENLQEAVTMTTSTLVAVIANQIDKLKTEGENLFIGKEIKLLTDSLTSIQTAFFKQVNNTNILMSGDKNNATVLSEFRKSLSP